MCLTFGNPSDPCCEDVPLVSTYGEIWRFVRAASIGDYAGLSDAEWQSGTTGHPAINTNCLYHHFQVPNMRTTTVFNVLNPIRWSPMAPSGDGGVFDVWAKTGLGYYAANDKQQGLVGLRRGFIPRNWHCQFRGGVAIAKFLPFPGFCVSNTGDGIYDEAALHAIAPSINAFGYDGSSKTFPVEQSIFAIAHRLNGEPVGGVITGESVSDESSRRIRVRPEDVYEIDIWYRIGFTANPLLANGATKGCALIRQSKVSNGSEFVPTQTNQVNTGSPGPATIGFRNVDFSPSFNAQQQTFEVTVVGHRGWRLAYGSNGPHTLRNGEAGELSPAVASTAIICTIDSESPFSKLSIYWATEIPFAVLANSELQLIYRSSQDSDQYLSASSSTDHGPIRHSPAGRFDSQGTTVFELVAWTLDSRLPFEEFGQISEGTAGADPPIPAFVPRRIIVTRVSNTD